MHTNHPKDQSHLPQQHQQHGSCAPVVGIPDGTQSEFDAASMKIFQSQQLPTDL